MHKKITSDNYAFFFYADNLKLTIIEYNHKRCNELT